MVVGRKGLLEMGASTPTTTTRRRHIACLLIVIADAGLLAWGAMAALAPDLLPGPGSAPILAAGYEGFTRESWQELVRASPGAAEFMAVLFRVYGAYIVALLLANTIAFVSAMAYDWTVHAIGPAEMSEYLGLAVIYGALGVTAPFLRAGPARG
jgi:hypothetical protein